jgi:DNA polymerase III epsilon subunit-like protein
MPRQKSASSLRRELITLILFVDVEVGGPNPQAHSLLALGACVYENGKIEETFHSVIKHKTYRITASALRELNIDLSEQDAIGDNLRHCTRQFTNWVAAIRPRALGNRLYLGGHNIDTMRRYIEAYIPDWDAYFHREAIDIHAIASCLRDVDVLDKTVKLSLGGLTKHFGIDHGGRHLETFGGDIRDAISTADYEECKANNQQWGETLIGQVIESVTATDSSVILHTRDGLDLTCIQLGG